MVGPIATASSMLYHCAVVTCYILQTCAIHVTCDLIVKHIYFYSICPGPVFHNGGVHFVIRLTIFSNFFVYIHCTLFFSVNSIAVSIL